MKENEDRLNLDFADMSDIDDLLLDDMNKPGLIDQMESDSEKREEAKIENSWWDDVRKDPAIYVFLAVSAVFTALLGVMMGLAPEQMIDPATGASSIYFHDDWVHIVIMILFVVGFIGVTEYPFAVGKRKHQEREEGNLVQGRMASAVMVISFLSIIVTGATGGVITASVLGFLDRFQTIPPGAQLWAAIAIPLLIAVHSALLTKYKFASRHAKAERITRDQERRSALENQVRMNRIKQKAYEKMQYARIAQYWQKVKDGLLTEAEAQAALDAGETLYMTEKRLGRDITGDGVVGHNPRTRPLLVPPGRPWECVQCGTANPSNAQFCMSCGASAATNGTQAQKESSYHPVPMEPRSRDGKNGANFQ